MDVQHHLPLIVDVHAQTTAIGEAAKEQFVGQGLANELLDQALRGASAHQGVKALLGQVLAKFVAEGDIHLLLGQLAFELQQELVDHPQDDLAIERGDLTEALAAAQGAGRTGRSRAEASLAAASACWRLGQVEAADSLFRDGIGHVRRSVRERYDDLAPIASERDTMVFNALDADDRETFRRRFWNEHDPDLATPENEARLEYWARVTQVYLLYFDARRRAWDERGEVYVRYGPPARATYNPLGVPLRSDNPGRTAGNQASFPLNVLVWEYPVLGLRVVMHDRSLNEQYELPVSLDTRAADHVSRNTATLETAEQVLARGGAVGMFPEGVSLTDRALLPLHRGSARLLLRHARHPGATPVTIVPVTLHYADRRTFRSTLTVTLGAPVRHEDLATPAIDCDTGVMTLTARIASALRAGLVAHEGLDGEAARALEPFIDEHEDAPGFERAQALVRALAQLARRAPLLHRELLHRARRHERLRRVLRVGDPALAPWRAPSPGRVALALVLAPAACLGALAFAPVWLAVMAMDRHPRAREDSHVPLLRVVTLMVTLPVWLATLAWLLVRALQPMALAWTAFGVAMAGGLALCAALPAWLRVWDRARLAWCERSHPRAVARARALHARLAHDATQQVRRAHAALDGGRALGVQLRIAEHAHAAVHAVVEVALLQVRRTEPAREARGRPGGQRGADLDESKGWKLERC